MEAGARRERGSLVKQGSGQSAVLFVTFLVVLSAGVRLFRSEPPVVPADAAGLDLAAYRARAQGALDARGAPARPLAAGERVAVNRAEADELTRLPGVGVGLAGRIVEERRRSGGFRTASDLTRVSGIGTRTARALAKHLDFSGAGPARAPASPAAGRPAERAAPASRLDAPTSRFGSPASGGDGNRGAASGAVDLNRADAAQLQRLRGIGPALARRIIAFRDSAGPFRRVNDLVAVPGIGPATLKRIRGEVRVDGAGGGSP